MYATGTPFDFEQRLHEMPVNVADLQLSFSREGQNYIGSTYLHTQWSSIPVTGTNYTGNITYDMAVRWDREYAKRRFTLLNIATTGGTFL